MALAHVNPFPPFQWRKTYQDLVWMLASQPEEIFASPPPASCLRRCEQKPRASEGCKQSRLNWSFAGTRRTPSGVCSFPTRSSKSAPPSSAICPVHSCNGVTTCYFLRWGTRGCKLVYSVRLYSVSSNIPNGSQAKSCFHFAAEFHACSLALSCKQRQRITDLESLNFRRGPLCPKNRTKTKLMS